MVQVQSADCFNYCVIKMKISVPATIINKKVSKCNSLSLPLCEHGQGFGCKNTMHLVQYHYQFKSTKVLLVIVPCCLIQLILHYTWNCQGKKIDYLFSSPNCRRSLTQNWFLTRISYFISFTAVSKSMKNRLLNSNCAMVRILHHQISDSDWFRGSFAYAFHAELLWVTYNWPGWCISGQRACMLSPERHIEIPMFVCVCYSESA
jgi:hypothetical protein